jgi:D-sedoheptulose 7-phosphate isomerase
MAGRRATHAATAPHADVAPDYERRVEQVRSLLIRSGDLKRELAQQHAGTIVDIARRMAGAVNDGRKILFCGNGGSAADAQHLAAELLVRLTPQSNRRPFPALSLATDVSSLTACANDFEYDAYFERMVIALGVAGDVLVGISTSGKSMSVVRALQAARERKIVTIGLLGGDGEPAASACDMALVVPSFETARVQECHIAVGHALIELVENFSVPAPSYD